MKPDNLQWVGLMFFVLFSVFGMIFGATTYYLIEPLKDVFDHGSAVFVSVAVGVAFFLIGFFMMVVTTALADIQYDRIQTERALKRSQEK